MKGVICFEASNKCYAPMWSYGEICVGCNCCGRQQKGLKMYEARLNYHHGELNRHVNFEQWAEGFPELIETQKANIKRNIAHHKAKIKYCEKVIKRLLSK